MSSSSATADEKHAAKGPPCKTHGNTVYLVLVSIISLMLIGIFTMYERAHDPEWWKHVGIRHDRNSKNGKGGDDQDNQVVLLDDGNMFVAPSHHHNTPNSKGGRPASGGIGGGGDVRNFPLQDGRPLNGRYAESRKLIDFSKIGNGTHFIADYDAMSTATPQCEAQNPHNPKQKKQFDYIDITSPRGKWQGVWLSQHPYVAMIPEFLTDEECGQLVAEATKTLFRSQVAPYQNSGANPVNDVRTSSQAWLNPSFGIAKTVVDRVMEFLPQFNPNSHEELQILKYEKGQKYDAHNDYFDPKFYGPQPNNRAVTVFLYLTDGVEGGYTQFPRAGGRPPPMEFKSCDKGLRVRPTKRSIAIFYDMDCYGNLDDTSLHGGCKPTKGVKWGGTLWIRWPTK